MRDYEKEIEELHQFIAGWFTGQLGNRDIEFSRFERVMAVVFSLIGPDGVLIERDNLIDLLRNGYGKQSKDLKVWIENVQIQVQDERFAIVTYEEWQRVGENETARLATAVFREKADTPNGLEWLHVHEIWLDPK